MHSTGATGLCYTNQNSDRKLSRVMIGETLKHGEKHPPVIGESVTVTVTLSSVLALLAPL